MAAAIVLAQFGTASDATAELTAPAILFLAVVGLVVGWATPDRRPQRTEVAVAGIAFFLLATPFLFGAGATWAGYIKLDDTATWMALTDHSFEFGRGVGDLAPSTHSAVIDAYLGGSYPIGGFVPAKLMSTISGQDVAFTMQPSMAVAGAALALAPVRPGSAGRPRARALPRRYRCSPCSRRSCSATTCGAASRSSSRRRCWRWGRCWSATAMDRAVAAGAVGSARCRGGRPDLGARPGRRGLARRRSWSRCSWSCTATAAGARRGRSTWPTALCSFALSLPVLITPDGLFDPVDSSLTESTELGNLNGPAQPPAVRRAVAVDGLSLRPGPGRSRSSAWRSSACWWPRPRRSSPAPGCAAAAGSPSPPTPAEARSARS